jgi:hypothetical protein
MTAMDRRSPRVTCYKARQDPDHPKPHGISEAKLLPVLQAEAARLRIPMTAVEMAANDEGRRAKLAEQRDRVIDMYADGTIKTKTERNRRLAAIDDALDALDAAQVVVAVPSAVDWTQPPAVVNAVLRAMWSRVELGPDMMPARFVWRVPEWRS